MGARGLHESLLVLVEGMADVEDVRLAGLKQGELPRPLHRLGEPDLWRSRPRGLVSKAALSMATLSAIES